MGRHKSVRQHLRRLTATGSSPSVSPRIATDWRAGWYEKRPGRSNVSCTTLLYPKLALNTCRVERDDAPQHPEEQQQPSLRPARVVSSRKPLRTTQTHLCHQSEGIVEEVVLKQHRPSYNSGWSWALLAIGCAGRQEGRGLVCRERHWCEAVRKCGNNRKR